MGLLKNLSKLNHKFFSVMFKFPFLRDVMLALGFCDVSKESIEHLCGKEEKGNAVIILVGGAAESLDAHAGSYTVTIKNRKGFIRMALKTGFVSIVFMFLKNAIDENKYKSF